MGKKKTFTYATDPIVKEKASRKAGREKLTLSEKIDQMLRDYVKPVKKILDVGIPLPKYYIDFKNVSILKSDGSIEKLK
jgi:hypothetical protein